MTNRDRTGKIFWSALALLTLWCLCLAPKGWAQAAAKAGDIRVVLQPGDVARGSGAQAVKTTAAKGMAVLYQDLLETGAGGRLRARLDDGSILAVGPQSQLRVVQHNAETQQTDLQLQYGKVRAQVVKLTKPNSHFEIRSNTAVAGVIGTDEIVDAFSPLATMVICIEGRIEVRNVDPNVPGSVFLNPGEMTIVNQGAVPDPPRPATPAELQGALDGTSGAAPQAVADIGTGFVTAGQNLLLDGSDSFATGGITSYRWILTREGGAAPVYGEAMAAPRVSLDTTPWQPGNYNGTLEIVTPSNATAQTSFGLVVIPSDAANANPEELIRQLQQAYETLQPSEFMKLFNPDQYSGYAALQASIESSFRNLSQARVFVRRASGQFLEGGHQAIYQVDFEIHFSTKAHPEQLFIVREQATLRMESGSPWTITDVPQGSLGSAGLPGIPGVEDPSNVNNPGGPANGEGDTVTIEGIPTGGGIVVAAGSSSNVFQLENTSPSPVTVTFTLPPGITLNGNGVPGTTFTIPAGSILNLIFTAAPGTPAGTIVIPTILNMGSSTLPGPDILVTVTPPTVFQLSLSFPGGVGTVGNPVAVLLGGSATSPLTVSTSAAAGQSVTLAGSGGGVTASFSPNPVNFPQGATSANSTITVSAPGGAAAGAGQLSITGTSGNNSANGTLFVNRITPFTISLIGPSTRSLAPNDGQNVSLSINLDSFFSGEMQITPPVSANGISFQQAPVFVTSCPCPITFNFRVTSGPTPVQPSPFTFIATLGGFSQTITVNIGIAQPIDFTLGGDLGGVISLQPAQSRLAVANVAFVSGIPQPVSVAVLAGSVNTNLLTVTGGGTIPNAAGTVSFNVTALPNAPPGITTFTVTATAGGTVRQATTTVTILGSFTINAPSGTTIPRDPFASTTSSFSIVPSQGFNAAVALTYSSNNAGVTVSGPATLSPGQNGSLNLTASASASGPAAITIQGVSGDVTRTATVTVNITAFTLTTTAVQPIALAIGGTVSLPVTVTPLQGFSGTVQLTATGTNGITADTPAPVTSGSGTRTFTLSAAVGATAGPATVTVTATSGGLTATLQVAVVVSDGFTMSSDPATWFLGNATPLFVRVQRSANFSGSVTVQVGALPVGIVDVQPRSEVISSNSFGAVFQVIASASPGLNNRTVDIPFTAGATPSPATLAEGGFGGDAQLVAFNASGTLQIPFDAEILANKDVPINLTPLTQVGDAIDVAVGVTFAQSFGGPVTVTGNASGGLIVASSPVELSASGAANVRFVGLLPGTFFASIEVRAEAFVVLLRLALVVNPPPFTLQITPSPNLIQFNSTLPTSIQVQVMTQAAGFNQPVTVEVPDGKKMKYAPSSCAAPTGFVSYIGGRLTFTVNPPYAPVSFCMEVSGFTTFPAPGLDSISITGFASGVNPVDVPVNLRLGIPQIVVTRASTFNIPLGGTVNANVAVNSIEGFNLPVQLRITGPSSYSNDGINLDPLPSELSSPDCGPASAGKILPPNSSTSCQIKNISTGGNPAALDLLAFALFPVVNPETSEEAAFQVCALGPTQPAGCGAGILGTDPAITTERQIPNLGPTAQDRGRLSLDIRNGECGGLRFLTGTSSFCGGGTDLEMMPALTAAGQIQTQGMAMNGGIIDLGPQATSGTMDVPESGYSLRASLESGHLYAVQSQGKYALVYVGAVRSELDPRLAAKIAGVGAEPVIEGLDGASGDSMADTLLDRALISVELQWVYSGDGGRHLQYSFTAAPAVTARPGLYRQPRQSAQPAAE